MDLAAVIIVGLAMLVSAVALILGEKRERKRSTREEAAEKRAEKAEERALNAEKREEERARREEIELLSSQQGRPSTDPVSREPGSNRSYRFVVTNIRKSAMSDLKPELVNSSGEKYALSRFLTFFLGHCSRRTEFVLTVTDPGDQNRWFLQYSWIDSSGFRERLSNVTIPPT